MKTGIKSIVATAALLTLCGSAFADYQPSRRAVYDYAKVVSSQPIVDYVTVRKPVRECWEEMEYYTIDHGARHARGGALVGAIIGGVVGHQFGSGNGKDAATAAGTLIGAAIGGQAARKRHGVEQVAHPVRRCQSSYQEHREERVRGYSVTYRYHGQTYRTEMPYDPGRRLRIRVDVRPAG